VCFSSAKVSTSARLGRLVRGKESLITGLIKNGSVVRVSKTADQEHLRDRLGKVVEDSQPGTVVSLTFQDGNGVQQFHRDVLEMHLDRCNASWNVMKANNLVSWSNPATRAKRTSSVKRAMKSELTLEKEEEILRVYEELKAKQPTQYATLQDYLSRPSLEKEVARICCVKLNTVRNLRFRRRREPTRQAYHTNTRLQAYLKEIQSVLPYLSDADIVQLLKDNGILGNLLFKSKGGVAEVLRCLRNGKLPRINPQERERVVPESDYESPEAKIDPHVADHAKALQVNTETVEHIVDSQLAALRARWFQEGTAANTLATFCSGPGGVLFQEITRRFVEEINGVDSLETPWWALHKNGRPVPPSPMQKYVAWRLKRDRVMGNWSGTGAGKTDSAGLAAYVIGSHLTVVLASNSTLLGWKEQLEETFPGCRVYTHISDVQRGAGTFLILNYEKFQTKTAGNVAKRVISLQPDLVVLDEVQLVKQRDSNPSNRSTTIRVMLARLPKAHILGMSATPVINELQEGFSVLEAISNKKFPYKSKATIPNALDLFAALRQIGVRYIPKYEQAQETMTVSTQRDDLLSSLRNIKEVDILPIEQTLLPAKLEAIRDRIKPGTVMYLEYVEGMVNIARAFVESLGYSVGEYVGDTDIVAREKAKKQFIAGEIDVLIGSRAIGIGVDGLQQRCVQLVILSLPWTHAAYAQVVGRVYRQGGTGTVQIVIPQVVVGSSGGRWSWDEARMKHIESKRTLAECATDGVIPTTSTLSRKVLAVKAIAALNSLSKRAKASSV
jgi:superfamily II DNA or RNA helicase